MNYKIGLDIGIASVGWATVLLDENDEPVRIWKMGSRVFEKAEQPKTGESLALPRREARSARRRTRRRSHRKERIRNLIAEYSIMSLDEINNLYTAKAPLTDIYQIRFEALDRLLCKEEFVRLLIHFSQRRGFKSNRKADGGDKKSDEGKLLSAVNKNKNLLLEKGYRTIGEMLYKDEKFQNIKRNKAESYENTFLRSMITDEIELIFEKQKAFGSCFVPDDFCERFVEILCSQRNFDEGPGGNSIYGGNQIEKMCGSCTFEKDEMRAFKAQFSFEYFSLLQKINSLRLCKGQEKLFLDDEQRSLVKEFCFNHASVNYQQLRKALSLSDDTLFNISYNDDIEKVEKKTKFEYLKCYQAIKKAFGKTANYLSTEKLNAIGYALSAYKNDEKITEYLAAEGLSETEITLALTLPSFSKTGNLSVKACEKIIPFLEQGMQYDKACESAGYSFKNENRDERTMYLPANEQQAPELGDISNPVVRRAVSQTIKVINSIIREMGSSPCFISVELAREMARNFDDRRKDEKQMQENAAKNEAIKEKIAKEFNRLKVTGMDILKYKLYEEQNGKCLYSMEPLDLNRLFEPGYVDIDHILPYSISFDDTYNNKVLVKSKENRQKGNRLPLEYLQGQRRSNFLVYVNNMPNSKKKFNLLKEAFTEEDEKEFKERNLTDTKYISRFMYNFIRNHLLFAENNTNKKRTVHCVNGRATAYIRKRWGINKIREDGDLHHAVDAAVIACITEGMIKRISKYSKRHELDDDYVHNDEIDFSTGEFIDRFPMPYPHFRKELDIRTSNDPMQYLKDIHSPYYDPNEEIKPIFVSRMPNHKVTGQAHLETVKSKKEIDSGVTLEKISLSKLKLDKDGEIDRYYNPSSDLLLYNALKQRLQQFGGNGEKAFAEPFFKPKADGSQGPLVKKVKITKPSTLSVEVQDDTAIAANGSMVRIDIFYKDSKYFAVPIYVSDTVKPTLPNKAIVQAKPYSQWPEMDDKNFIFSLYPNDLIKVTTNKNSEFSLVNKNSTLQSKKCMSEFFAYYKSINISSGTIHIINHDNTYFIGSFGIKSVPLLEKYQVDVLGNLRKVEKETRQYFNNMKK